MITKAIRNVCSFQYDLIKKVFQTKENFELKLDRRHVLFLESQTEVRSLFRFAMLPKFMDFYRHKMRRDGIVYYKISLDKA